MNAHEDPPEWLRRRIPFYLAKTQIIRFADKLRRKASIAADDASLRAEADQMVRDHIGPFPSEDHEYDPDEPYDVQLEQDMRSAAAAYYDGLKETESYNWGLMIVGIFHLWERDVRGVLRTRRPTDSKVETAKFDTLCKFLTEEGFNLAASPLFDDICLAYLVSNTIKHSDGPSAEKLYRHAPRLFKTGTKARHMRVGQLEFEGVVRATAKFWDDLESALER